MTNYISIFFYYLETFFLSIDKMNLSCSGSPTEISGPQVQWPRPLCYVNLVMEKQKRAVILSIILQYFEIVKKIVRAAFTKLLYDNIIF